MVIKQPVIVESAPFCAVCSFVIFAFERIEDQAGELQFKVEWMDYLQRMLRNSFVQIWCHLVCVLLLLYFIVVGSEYYVCVVYDT